MSGEESFATVVIASRAIAAVGYDDQRQLMRVHFHNGSIYEYADVPKSVFGEFLRADSAGQYFSSLVQSQFASRLVGSGGHAGTRARARDSARPPGIDVLAELLPAPALEFVGQLALKYKCEIVPKRVRRTKHGDCQLLENGNCIITLNVNGNAYQTLITTLHELSHAQVLQQRMRVASHGAEWKRAFSEMLRGAIDNQCFPPDLEQVVLAHSWSPKASSSSDLALQRALRPHDTLDHRSLVSELPKGTWFSLDGKTVLRKGRLDRSRFQCVSAAGERYRVSPTARVEVIYEQ